MFFQIALENILLLINNIHETPDNNIHDDTCVLNLRHLSIDFLAYISTLSQFIPSLYLGC